MIISYENDFKKYKPLKAHSKFMKTYFSLDSRAYLEKKLTILKMSDGVFTLLYGAAMGIRNK